MWFFKKRNKKKGKKTRTFFFDERVHVNMIIGSEKRRNTLLFASRQQHDARTSYFRNTTIY